MSTEGIDPQVAGGEEEDPCGPSSVGKLGLRIGAVFIILVRFDFSLFFRKYSDLTLFPYLQATSLLATLFPVITKRVTVLRRAVPGAVFEFAK
jgi:zinc transporter 1/2/3